MHIKMSWMKSIKCLPPILQKQATADNLNHTAHWGDEHTWATSHTQGEACILKAGSQDGERSRGVGRGLPWWELKTCFLFHAHCSRLLFNILNGRHELPSLLIVYLFECDEERTQRGIRGKTLKTSPHVQFTFIVWTCVLITWCLSKHNCAL